MADPFKTALAVIKGDPIIALIAQVNRFQKKYGKPEFPLSGPITLPIAVIAHELMRVRLTAAVITWGDTSTIQQLQKLTGADPIPYVQNNLAEVTRVLALYGDTLGLPPAKYGITGKRWGAFEWIALFTVFGFGGYYLYRRRQLSRT